MHVFCEVMQLNNQIKDSQNQRILKTKATYGAFTLSL